MTQTFTNMRSWTEFIKTEKVALKTCTPKEQISCLMQTIISLTVYLEDQKMTMTSYPVCNKTSISQKPYIADKKLLYITIRKLWSLFQNPSWKIVGQRPLTKKTRWHHIRLAIKPNCYLGNHAPQIKVTKDHYQEVIVALSESVMKNCVKRPLAAK